MSIISRTLCIDFLNPYEKFKEKKKITWWAGIWNVLVMDTVEIIVLAKRGKFGPEFHEDYASEFQEL